MIAATGTDPVFAPETYRSRYAALRAMLAAHGLDAIIVWSFSGDGYKENVEYLIGRHVTNTVVLFPAVGDPVGFAQPRAVVTFAHRLSQIELRDGGHDFLGPLCDAIVGRGLQQGTIGLVEVDSLRTRGLPHLLVDGLRERFPQARFPTVTEEFELLRLTLAPEEEAWLERAARDLDQIMEVFVDTIRPGVTVGAIEMETRRYAAERGLRLSALSVRAARLDGTTPVEQQRDPGHVMGRDECILFESSSRYGPYKAYRGYPIALSAPPPATRNLFDTALEAAQRCAAALRPGGTTSDIVAIGEFVRERGVAMNGPLVFALVGGWQMICQRGFDAYRPPREIRFAPGMWFQDDPHVCSLDWSMTAIVGNTVVVTPEGSRVAGEHGFRYVVKE